MFFRIYNENGYSTNDPDAILKRDYHDNFQ